MKTRINYAIIGTAVFSIVILLAHNNIEKAFAIGVIKTTVDATLTNIPCVGYKPNYDYTILFDGTDTELEVVDASDGSLVTTVNVSISCTGTVTSTTDLPSNGIMCPPTGNLCLYATTASPNFRLGILDLSDFSHTVYSATNSSYAGCRVNGLTYSGSSTAKGVMSNCTNSALNGLYSISWGLIGSGAVDSAILTQRDNTTPSNGLQSSCYDSTTQKVVFGYSTGASTGGFRTVSTSNVVTFIDATDDVDQVTCGSGYSIGVGDGADIMNVLNVASNTIVSTTTAVTNGHVALRHVDTVFVTDGTTSVKLYQWNSSGAMTSIGTLTGFDINGSLLSGNATRIMGAGITGTIASHYVIFDLSDDGSGGGGLTPNQEFCANPANANILTCRLLAQNQTAIGSASESVGTSINNIFVQVGLVEEGSDIQTNGVGYMIVVVLVGIFASMLFLATGGELNKIPTFVWFLGVLAILGACAGFGFVEPLFFIIGILVIIALASAKILSTLEIGGFR